MSTVRVRPTTLARRARTISATPASATPPTPPTATPPARAAHRPSRRDDILRAGVRVFASTGYNDATVADIAREAGVSPRAVYYHFATKESLLVEATQPVADVLVAIVRRTMTAYHPRDWRLATATMLAEIFAWADEHADEATLYYVWSRLGLPAVAAIRDQVLATCIELGTPPASRSRPRAGPGRYAQELARVVAVDTADDVMSALFAGDTFDPIISRDDVARALADNNGSLISQRCDDLAATALRARSRELVADPRAQQVHENAVPGTDVPARGAHRPSRRQDLIDAAAAEFAVRGVADTTVAHVTDRAGMAPNAVYYHYASKHRLFLDVLDDVSRQVADVIVPSAAVADDARPAKGADLLAAWDRFSRWAERFPDRARIHLTASAAISVESERVRRAAQLAVVERTKAWMRLGVESSTTDIDAHVGAIALGDLFRRASAIVLLDGGRSAALDAAVVDVGLRILIGAHCDDAADGSTPPAA
ncbi:MAG: TetR family transcriptional regulator [Ilumatobacteraceae bacterium]